MSLSSYCLFYLSLFIVILLRGELVFDDQSMGHAIVRETPLENARGIAIAHRHLRWPECRSLAPFERERQHMQNSAPSLGELRVLATLQDNRLGLIDSGLSGCLAAHEVTGQNDAGQSRGIPPGRRA
jgi:hypothetical protein